MVIDKKISLTALIKAKNQLAYAIKNANSDINSPRTVFIEAFKNQLIDNLSAWNSFITQRNLTSHTYDEEIALEVFDSLPQFLDHLLTYSHD